MSKAMILLLETIESTSRDSYERDEIADILEHILLFLRSGDYDAAEARYRELLEMF